MEFFITTRLSRQGLIPIPVTVSYYECMKCKSIVHRDLTKRNFCLACGRLCEGEYCRGCKETHHSIKTPGRDNGTG